MTRSARAAGMVAVMVLAAAQFASATPQAEKGNQPNMERALKETSFLSGKVAETMDGGGYTYVLLEKQGAKIWVAMPRTKVKVGQEIALQPGIEMANFPSKALNRTFERIYFSGGLMVKQDAANDEAMKSAHGGKSLAELQGKTSSPIAKPPVVDNVKVDKAAGPNAFTVAEIYGKKGTLDRQKVVVKGKVVKVSTGIMGKNWVHLRDGSGDPAQQTNNLVVTTQDDASVGDVVTAKGMLYKDKDFGAGYRYDVIMEEATLAR